MFRRVESRRSQRFANESGRHTELRVSRVRCRRYAQNRHPSLVEVIRKLDGQWPDREVAVTMNRMRCNHPMTKLGRRYAFASFANDWASRHSIRKQPESRDQCGPKQQPAWESALVQFKSSSVKACCRQLSSCPSVAALESEVVKIGVREIVGTPARKYRIHHDDKTPGF